MRATLDYFRFALVAVTAMRTRALLVFLANTIAVGSVVVLSSLGEGLRTYVIDEFAALGTNLLIVVPGRTETSGAGISLFMGASPRDLTLEDARAIAEHPLVVDVAPLIIGTTAVSWGNRERDVPVLGSTSHLSTIRQWLVSQGTFLTPQSNEKNESTAVLGSKTKQELFGNTSAVGEWIRIGDRRFRVIGELGDVGRSIGIDVDDVVIVPVRSAQTLFDVTSLFRIFVQAQTQYDVKRVEQHIFRVIGDRHYGEADVTVVTQGAVMNTFSKIFDIVTYAVIGIAGISLVVAGMLIMNIMFVAVTQRRAEIGVLMAIGGRRAQIMAVFLVEAGLLAGFGVLLGWALGEGASLLLTRMVPQMEFTVPNWAPVVAGLVAVITALAFALLPAYQATRISPILALKK